MDRDVIVVRVVRAVDEDELGIDRGELPFEARHESACRHILDAGSGLIARR
jgi:hypothetical protein